MDSHCTFPRAEADYSRRVGELEAELSRARSDVVDCRAQLRLEESRTVALRNAAERERKEREECEDRLRRTLAKRRRFVRYTM